MPLVKVFQSETEAKNSIPVGKIQLLIINGRKLGLAHFVEGFVAFDNNCPHQNEPLHKGMLTKFGEVVCPLHFYRFDSKTGQETNNRCQPLELFPVVIDEEGLFIQLK